MHKQKFIKIHSLCLKILENIKILTSIKVHNSVIIIIVSLFQEDNIFDTNASLTYGPQLQR